MKRLLRNLLQRRAHPAGTTDMGDLARTTPISREYGFDRGMPVDRHYIEAFLASYRADIHGRVLEFGEPIYSAKFGSGIMRQDVLHVVDEPQATIVGDLTDDQSIPEAAFDCIIATQVLQFIYDIAASVRGLRRALRPGGVALVTVPGVTCVRSESWGGDWFWSLGEQTARRLFGEVFGPENVDVTIYGNVYAATCFLYGLAVEEVDREKLDERDAGYPVTVAIRARNPF